MSCNETIVKIGAEGGSLTLYGSRSKDGWIYSLNAIDHSLNIIGEDEDIENSTEIVRSWSDALNLLDKYPWHSLFPVEVHPEFRDVIFSAVAERLRQEGEENSSFNEWKLLCEKENGHTEDIGSFSKVESKNFNLTKSIKAPTSMSNNSSQIVYVLTNPAMPGLVKIGMTTQQEVEERMKQLYGTGVPVPFECAFACQVKDASEVEKALHFAFGSTRINPNREFFSIEAERVITILKLLKVDDITVQVEAQIESDVTTADKQSAQNLKISRRPKMNFKQLGIPNGSVIVFKDGEHQAIVVDERKVEFEGEVCFLVAATRKILGLSDDYPLQPSPHWTFNGKLLKEIYEDYHSAFEEA